MNNQTALDSITTEDTLGFIATVAKLKYLVEQQETSARVRHMLSKLTEEYS